MTTQTATREHPIIFNDDMILAILAGRKTQTRRVIFKDDSEHHMPWWVAGTHWQDGDDLLKCPYGQPGDVLWCKETWSPDHATFYPNFPIVYRAEGEIRHSSEPPGKTFSPESNGWFPFRWRSPIHMPRHASRITLEITGVRIERLNSITEENAIAEGIDGVANNFGNGPAYCDYSMARLYDTAEWFRSPTDSFRTLWDSINGSKHGFSWESNPFVWVISFRRIKP